MSSYIFMLIVSLLALPNPKILMTIPSPCDTWFVLLVLVGFMLIGLLILWASPFKPLQFVTWAFPLLPLGSLMQIACLWLIACWPKLGYEPQLPCHMQEDFNLLKQFFSHSSLSVHNYDPPLFGDQEVRRYHGCVPLKRCFPLFYRGKGSLVFHLLSFKGRRSWHKKASGLEWSSYYQADMVSAYS